RYDDALNAFSRVVQGRAAPEDQARAYYNIGITRFYKQELLPAEQALVKSLELDPTYLPAWDSYINVAVESGKQQSLRDQLQESLKKNPDARTYYGLAKIAAQENRFKEAVDYYKQATGSYKSEKMFFFNYALALEGSGDMNGAIDR